MFKTVQWSSLMRHRKTDRYCRNVSSVRANHHGLGVVVREGIVETGFDDPFLGCGHWRAGW